MMEKVLSSQSGQPVGERRTENLVSRRVARGTLVLLALFLVSLQVPTLYTAFRPLPPHAAIALSRCRALSLTPGPSVDFYRRKESDRFVPGTKPYLLRNGKVWTGAENGTEVIRADILLDKGIIKSIGHIGHSHLKTYRDNVVTVDLKGAWVTPGIIDLHSHLGVDSAPRLLGATDTNSHHGPILPWLRALDGLNTHDAAYALSVAGGVTTALVLPGSANAIGGQGFTIKLRETAERTPTSMLLEPPYQINASFPDQTDRPRWRQMKHACGENPSRVYGNTRMDTIWAFRQAYDTARKIKESQDAYCVDADAGNWDALKDKPYPEDLQWESLVDVLRGRVKVQVHCYETVDIDDLIRISNEFEFPIAAFHHAHEAYLVPDTLKKAYDHPPAIAMFATHSRYKREAYRGSEFAPRILAEHGIPVVMKSDHPVTDSRYLLYQAQLAFVYGLPENLAIASISSTPAEVMGMGHRIGYVKEGWDADLVVWDSHPLALGATPKQVFIDGIPQLKSPHVVNKPASFQRTPKVPNFDKEAADAVKYEGLPPLIPSKTTSSPVVFMDVKSVFVRADNRVREVYSAQDAELGAVIVQNGTITCMGTYSTCVTPGLLADAEIVNVKGGSISPGFTSFGSNLGLGAIGAEPSTMDGYVFDPLVQKVPAILGGDGTVIRAVDGLSFGTRDALIAYRAGVTKGITAPAHRGFYAGLGTSFFTGATNRLDRGAVLQEATAVHITVRPASFGSISTQIATLRRLLLRPIEGDSGDWFRGVGEGRVTLVVDTDSADIIATLILLKREVEKAYGNIVKMTVTGAQEAHILAKEIAEAGVGVIQTLSKPFPSEWEGQRILPGLPLSEQTSIAVLLAQNITVGIGTLSPAEARNLPFEVAWVALDAGRAISKEEAIALGSTNVEILLGGDIDTDGHDMVVTEGGDILDMQSKVVAVVSPARQLVDLL
ncbi:carbohydrate esterase family 9 protein [Daedalea quercina L-15889]|uniref:Carbohydrate esterase family 9 protein n=1 Tax=Daedalea quercina L-15889 TaxID=1314783 RepID=A0A165SIP9_9APHY|nr:carbohydrate esterase family 9 protein [Daedalea quercina L-15889]